MLICKLVGILIKVKCHHYITLIKSGQINQLGKKSSQKIVLLPLQQFKINFQRGCYFKRTINLFRSINCECHCGKTSIRRIGNLGCTTTPICYGFRDPFG